MVTSLLRVGQSVLMRARAGERPRAARQRTAGIIISLSVPVSLPEVSVSLLSKVSLARVPAVAD